MMREEAWLEVIEEAVTPLRYGASHKLFDRSSYGLERKKATEGLCRRDMDGGLDDGEVIALEIESKVRKHFADATPYGLSLIHILRCRRPYACRTQGVHSNKTNNKTQTKLKQ